MGKKSFKKPICLLTALMLSATPLFAACADNTPTAADVTVTVEGGSGGGTYKEGDKCTVTAEVPAGYRFVEWANYGYGISTANPYTFDVDFDITLVAVYEALPKDKFTVTVDGGMIGDTGLSSATLEEGTKVEINASQSQSRKFVKWLIDGEESVENPYKLTVRENISLVAVFDEYCMISVSGGTVDGERSKILAQGSEVTVTANASSQDQGFKYWYTLDENYKEEIVSYETEYTFSLDESMKIYAKFLDYYTVQTVNGIISGTEADSDVTVFDGETVTVTPLAAPSGKAFIGWYEDGTKVSLNEDYTFTVTQNVTLEAGFGELRTEQLPALSSKDNKDYPDTGLIYREPGGAVALMRTATTAAERKSAFPEGVDYICYKIYSSVDADKENDCLGEIKLYPNSASTGVADYAKLSSMDGKMSMNVRGNDKDMYFDGVDYPKFQNLIKYVLGYNYSAGQEYYFAAQYRGSGNNIITFRDDFALRYENGDISDICTCAFVENASAPKDKFTVTVLNGSIDGNLTEVTAGYGANITLSIEAPAEGMIFLGWKTVTMNGEEEVYGDLISRNLTCSYTVKGNVTLKAHIVDESSIEFSKLDTPVMGDNKIIYEEQVGGTIAIDRTFNGSNPRVSTLFGDDVAYSVFYMYTSPDAEKDDYVGAIRVYVDIHASAGGGSAFVGYFTLMDGTRKTEIIRGDIANYYIIERAQLNELVKAALGANYNANQAYYFAAQKIALPDDIFVLDSDISDIGTNGIKF